MQITVDLPDDIDRHPNPGREALESLAVEGYRSQALTHYQASPPCSLRADFSSSRCDQGTGSFWLA